MLLFGFSGKMRAGKDTAADYIEHRLQAYGYQVQRFAFADTIKRIAEFAQTEAGLPLVKDRELLQYLGADWGRKHDPDVWVKALERKIVAARESEDVDVILVTDLRFPNELEMLDRQGFTSIRTFASDSIRAIRGAEVDKMDHISETALDAFDRPGVWDWFLDNSGTLKDFHGRLDLVVARAMLEAGSF